MIKSIISPSELQRSGKIKRHYYFYPSLSMEISIHLPVKWKNETKERERAKISIPQLLSYSRICSCITVSYQKEGFLQVFILLDISMLSWFGSVM